MAGWISALKDTALAATVRQFLDSRLNEYGKIQRFHIDTKARQIELSILLEGEANAVEIRLTGYEILEIAGRTSVVAPKGGFASSRIWLGRVLNRELGDKSFEIPAKFAPYARTLAG